jgi:hypothetical protein
LNALLGGSGRGPHRRRTTVRGDRWIQQYRKLSDQAPFGPIDLDQEIEERLPKGIFGGYPNYGSPVRELSRLEPQLGKQERTIKPGLCEVLRGRERYVDGIDPSGFEGNQLDLGIKAFIQRRSSNDIS